MEVNIETETLESEPRIGHLSNVNITVGVNATQAESESGNPNGLQSAQCVDALLKLEESNNTIKNMQANANECEEKTIISKKKYEALCQRLDAADKDFKDLKENHGRIVENCATMLTEEHEKRRQLEEENQRLKEQLRNNKSGKSCRQKMEHLKYDHAKEMQALIAEFDTKRKHTQNDFEEKIRALQSRYDYVLVEKETLTLRLSKLASSNLTYNNPNIADLSDQNRPTKLAEKFSELYDNQWTDAFEDLKMEEERVKVKCLADILKSVYNHCTTVAKQQSNSMWTTRNMLEIQYENKTVKEVERSEHESNKVSTCDHKRADIEHESDLTTTVENSSDTLLAKVDNQTGHDFLQPSDNDELTEQGFVILKHDDAVPVDTTNPDSSDNRKPDESNNKKINIEIILEDKLSVEERKQIGEIRKLLLRRIKDDVLKTIALAVADEFDITQREQTFTYITECAYVCWEMLLHDPPVHLKFVEVGDMDTIPFDGTAYRAYTRGGTLMDYVVWPPVYLHEKGPLLSKGVAQGK
ncbi:uncharacterized protein LOC127866855 isoform X2 [Dreissena polymorpha]|uniref:uncharacterized protein LOC127866855 isoform X2 n=1 Tax=Dreissena polymorpha TaxID=45954 RepID=UPI002264C118|nr:uncharacterized protein LOC127866855 isoform X2 [Dreissena polymorpha]